MRPANLATLTILLKLTGIYFTGANSGLTDYYDAVCSITFSLAKSADRNDGATLCHCGWEQKKSLVIHSTPLPAVLEVAWKTIRSTRRDYSQGKDGSLFVNLFIPSALDWKAKSVKVQLKTSYPEDGKVALIVKSGKKKNLPSKYGNPAG